MRPCSGLQNWLVPILITRPVERMARWSFFMVVLRFIFNLPYTVRGISATRQHLYLTQSQMEVMTNTNSLWDILFYPPVVPVCRMQTYMLSNTFPLFSAGFLLPILPYSPFPAPYSSYSNFTARGVFRCHHILGHSLPFSGRYGSGRGCHATISFSVSA